ncbi:MAG: nitronate monooxygenase [Chthonomonadales bacterium]
MNRLCDLLGCTIPIIQAPTGSVAGPGLALAVANAGGIGGMGVTWKTSDELNQAIKQMGSTRTYHVNYALHFKPETLQLALDAGVPVVTFSWGRAKGCAEICHSYGAKVGVQVGSLVGAEHAIADGANFIIVQGVEAGGHVQSSATIDWLLPQVVKNFGSAVPIVATGGISASYQIAQAMQMGADGVMLGTRYVCTQQSLAHEIYKQRIVESSPDDTALSTCFNGGWPNSAHRTLRNNTLNEWEGAGCPLDNRPGEGEEIALTATGESIERYSGTAPRVGMSGDIPEMALYAGMGVDGINDIPDAGELTQSLWAETLSILGE